MTNSLTTWDEPELAIDWARLGHVYVVGNGKGGVGKTTTSAHIAALVASDGARTLLIDLNGQGNCALLLGFANTERDDKGRNLFSAVTAGAQLTPVRNVRPNLDVVPGGPVRTPDCVCLVRRDGDERRRQTSSSVAG
jgi:chromosome partitioning protein